MCLFFAYVFLFVLFLVSFAPSLFRLFVPRDEDCIKVLEDLRWKNSVVCPYCDSKNVKKNGNTIRNGIPISRYLCNESVGKLFNSIDWYCL